MPYSFVSFHYASGASLLFAAFALEQQGLHFAPFNSTILSLHFRSAHFIYLQKPRFLVLTAGNEFCTSPLVLPMHLLCAYLSSICFSIPHVHSIRHFLLCQNILYLL